MSYDTGTAKIGLIPSVKIVSYNNLLDCAKDFHRDEMSGHCGANAKILKDLFFGWRNGEKNGNFDSKYCFLVHNVDF
jgi:hypothetical protein